MIYYDKWLPLVIAAPAVAGFEVPGAEGLYYYLKLMIIMLSLLLSLLLLLLLVVVVVVVAVVVLLLSLLSLSLLLLLVLAEGRLHEGVAGRAVGRDALPCYIILCHSS